MPRDIRSFFTVISKKSGSDSSKPAPAPTTSKRHKRVIDDSDDDDVIASTPEQIKKKSKPAVALVSSDSEDDQPKTKSRPVDKNSKKNAKEESSAPKLKPVSVADIFSSAPIKQSKVELVPESKKVNKNDGKVSKNDNGKSKKESKSSKKRGSKKEAANPELGVHNDDAFEKTLLELDDGNDDLFADNVDILEKTIEEASTVRESNETKIDTVNMSHGEKESSVLGKNSGKNNTPKSHSSILNKEDKEHSMPNESKSQKAHVENTSGAEKKSSMPSKDKTHAEKPSNEEKELVKHEKKRPRKESSEGSTPSKKTKLEHSDSGIDPDQEAFEKKRYSAMLYQKYLSRGGPKRHGQKELPEGKPDCLNNITFLRTGVLDSLESEEFEGLIKRHGGRVVHSVSKKVNYLVVGDDPGPAKLEKARELKIPTISEDALLDMILEKSGMPPKYCKKFESTTSEDLGVGSSENDSPEQSPPKKTDKEESKIVHQPKAESSAKQSKPEKSHDQSKTESSKRQSKPESSRAAEVQKVSEQLQSSKEEIKKVPEKTEKSKENKTSVEPSTSQQQTPNESNEKRKEVSCENLCLTEKYKPKDLKSVIGQQGENSNLNKLKRWLQNWHKNQQPEVRKKLFRPSPFAQSSSSNDGAYFKCALLSGPPGVGKTTTAYLVAKELGLDIVEFNASDTRSKKLLQQEVSQLLSSTTIAGFAAGQSKTHKNRVLLMDEVDGMAGNEDRGGIQELIQLIKNTSIPIICMCNDRNHQKMRSLVNYCFDLRFSKPKMEQIRGAMMSICFKEGIRIPPNALSEIITGTGCDIRQTLNHLTMWAASDKPITFEAAEREAKIAKKDTVMGLWEVCRTVFTRDLHKDMSLIDKSRLFFYDYSMGPLFAQENYIRVQPANCNEKESLLRAAKAADAISMGDLISSKIRSSNNWSLLDTQAMFSSVFPGYYMSGHFTKQINFPAWLGKNSSKNKHSRLLNELHSHTRASTTASKSAMNLEYVQSLCDAILMPMKKEGLAGVQKAVDVMKAYSLLRTDLDAIVELAHWTGKPNPMSNLEGQVKSSFTRTYNKEIPLLPFAAGSATSKKRAAATVDESDLLADEEDQAAIENDQEEEEDDNIENDASIKMKTKKGAAGKGKNATSEPGTSKKGDGPRKGRAKKK